MHSDLEAVVAADEEARSRLALAEERRERDSRAARAECDGALQRRRDEAQRALDEELRRVSADGDARVDALQVQQETYLGSLREAGERRFEEAVAAYLRIVCDVGGPP